MPAISAQVLGNNFVSIFLLLFCSRKKRLTMTGEGGSKNILSFQGELVKVLGCADEGSRWLSTITGKLSRFIQIKL